MSCCNNRVQVSGFLMRTEGCGSMYVITLLLFLIMCLVAEHRLEFAKLAQAAGRWFAGQCCPSATINTRWDTKWHQYRTCNHQVREEDAHTHARRPHYSWQIVNESTCSHHPSALHPCLLMLSALIPPSLTSTAAQTAAAEDLTFHV